MLERARAGALLTGGEIIVTDNGFADTNSMHLKQLASR
jgi:hypothetical protein